MTDSPRIEQFRKMATDDPDNELGHFSLGRACMDETRFDEAVTAFRRVIELKPGMSKAYQHLASCLLRLGQRQEAIEELTRGVKMAAEKGEMMPRNEMAQMLQELGAPIPEMQQVRPEEPVGEGQIKCSRCGQIAPRMAQPPFRNRQGQMIQGRVCTACWKEWVSMGTKVINELRLPLADPQAQRVFDQHMMEFLNLVEPKA
jgi:Fe-S cluster biosynthesis and repair protein YggX